MSRPRIIDSQLLYRPLWCSLSARMPEVELPNDYFILTVLETVNKVMECQAKKRIRHSLRIGEKRFAKSLERDYSLFKKIIYSYKISRRG